MIKLLTMKDEKLIKHAKVKAIEYLFTQMDTKNWGEAEYGRNFNKYYEMSLSELKELIELASNPNK